MKHFIKLLFGTGLLTFTVQSYAVTTTNTVTTNNIEAVTPAEKSKIEQVVQEFLLKKPEIIIQAVQKLQQKQYEETQQTVKQTQQTASTFAKDLFHQANDPTAGNPNGKVMIVEFFDYQCQHCIDMVPIMDAIIKANPNVRVIYKDFPIRGPVSEFAARAALAANQQNKYAEFSHALLALNKPLTQEIVLQVAKDKGLDVMQLQKDMDDKRVNDLLKSNTKLAQNLKLFGTPAFFIVNVSREGNINYVPGQIKQQQLQDILDKNSN